MVTGIFDNLKSSRVSPLWYAVPFASLATFVVYRTGKVSHSCCSSTVSARLVCCGLGFASHLIDLHLDDRILTLHGVLDDLGLFHLHCVRVVLGVYVHNLFNVRCLILSLDFQSSAGLYVFETCCVTFETLVISITQV